MRFSPQILGYIKKKKCVTWRAAAEGGEALPSLHRSSLSTQGAQNKAAFWKKPSARRGNIVSQVSPLKDVLL